MLGAIAGDMIGSVFERSNRKSTDFPLFVEGSQFTDDSVLTFAVADCLLNGLDYAAAYRRYALAYPGRGYGGMFERWIDRENAGPYNSFGNGSAMRVSPVAWAFASETEVLAEARRSAEPTHNHPEGVKGAQAVALAVFLARTARDKGLIRARLTESFGYDLARTVDSIRPFYAFDATCPGSVPEAVIAFLDSDSFEEAVRMAVSLGGDSDTIASIAGAIAEAYYGPVPPFIEEEVRRRLPQELRSLLSEFQRRHR